MVGQEDKLYASPLEEMVDFRFDERVVDVFPDMIQRSVPGYANMISTIGILAQQYAQVGTRCYDLGCSLGAVSLSIRQRLPLSTITEIIAVDNSASMVEKAAVILSNEPGFTPVELHCADINDISIENASVVVLNFTLQFVAPEHRQALVDKIYAGLVPGGILILSEKLAFESEQVNNFHIEAHHGFKRANGYSDLEISQKRSALEQVLIPETLTEHQNRLQQAGFEFIQPWFQCFNFASLLAQK
jgi:tRNA (cmo5U34)-methyltransferase